MRLRAIVAALLASATAHAAEPEVLDEARVVELALRTHPSITAASASSEGARAAASAADWARVPDLKLSGRYARISSIPARFRSFDGFTFPQLLDAYSGRASLSVPISDAFLSLASAARAAGHAADAAALEVTVSRAQVAFDARVAYLDWWSRTLAARNAVELLHAAEQNALDQRRRERAGTVARNDVLPFETALDSARIDLETARGEQARAEAALRAFVPDLRDRALAVPERIAERAPASSTDVPPRLAALEQQARAAEAQAESASRARLPSLSFYGNADVAAPNPRVFTASKLVAVPSWEVGVQLEWSLSQLTAGSAKTTQARAEHAAALARMTDARRKLDAERTSARAMLTAATARAERAMERITHATALAQARRGENEAGTALPLDVIVAETDLTRARNEWVDAQVARALAVAQLDFLEGRSLR